jgi:hypothetical protein
VLLVLGTKLSARVGNIFTLIKIAVVLFVIIVGFSYVKFSNYTPFVPASEPTANAGAADVMKQSFFGFLTGAAPAQYGTWASSPAPRWCSSPSSASTWWPPPQKRSRTRRRRCPAASSAAWPW